MNESDGIHLYLTASGFPAPALLDLAIHDNDASLSIHPGQAASHQRFNAMVANGGRLYVAGVADDTNYGPDTDNNALQGWFEDLVLNTFTDNGEGRALALSEDARHLFVTGMDGDNVFLRKYDLLTRTRDPSFGSNGEQILPGTFTYNIGSGKVSYSRFMVLNTHNVADSGLAITDGKVFLAFEQSPGTGHGENRIQIYEISIPNLRVTAHQDSPTSQSRNAGNDVSGLGWGVGVGVTVLVTAVTAITIVGISWYLLKLFRNRNSLADMLESVKVQ